MDDAFVESSNGRLRDECLKTHWSEPLERARGKSMPCGATTMKAVPTHRLAGLHRSNMVLPRPRPRPNERRKPIGDFDEKAGDRRHSSKPPYRSCHRRRSQGGA
ncbi:transposase [Sphingomonas sp. RHCKR7]|nr:transposase [Sphingomonas folli]